ncbi:SAVED domain-containing protein [Paraburkholderia nemoris]|uniref:HNH endonuclease n=1 Tax=Paraburkholderia nemoris TaxID=2793076 RepID=UPI0038BA5F45
MDLLVEPFAATTQEAVDEHQPLCEPPENLPILDDEGLAKELQRLAQGAGDVLVIANAYTVCVHHRLDAQAKWELVCSGDFDELSVDAAKPLTHGRLTWANVVGTPWAVDPDSVLATRMTVSLLKKWLKDSIGVTGGREGNVTGAIKEELYYLAGWRCQFTGCGRNLRHHAATGRRGRFSYFAHIVAASADGPRGDSKQSTALASDPSNFMLLCDECHRVIDKVNPARYTVEVLRKMREDSIAEVRRLLDTLQHKQSEVIAIVGNIAGQPAQFSIDDAHEALWGAGLRSDDAKPARYFYPGGQHHDVHSAAYWASLFQQMKLDLPMLQTLLNGTRAGAARPRLSVFPMHSTSVLLLAGRLLGDTEGTYLFQPHRNKVGPGTRWAWPTTHAMPALDKFKAEVVRPDAGDQDAATLIVALTSDIDAARLPADCAHGGELLLPTLRITGPTFDKDCMQQPEDLQLVGLAVDAAMRKLQDEWRVQKVYLFVSAPASAVVVVGQKMQARHHAAYICHEAQSGPGSPYKATIELTSTLVCELVSGLAQSHPLQP